MATRNSNKVAISLSLLEIERRFDRLFSVRKNRIIIGLLLGLLGAGCLYLLTVNTPFWDEWELVPIFQHLHAGYFYWHDFWQNHNGHRLVLPTVLLVTMAYVTSWNIRLECLMALLIAISSFMLLRKLVLKELSFKHKALLLIGLAFIWFSPVQAENWLWGWQIEWFMNVAGVVVTAYGVARLVNEGMTRNTLFVLLAGVLLSQYSLGNGTLLWLILFAILLYLRLSIKQFVIPAAVGIVSSALYYAHYTNPARSSKLFILRHIFGYAEYVFGYLGRPLSFLHKPAVALGLLLTALFTGIGLYLFIKQRAAFTKALPWLLLGMYAIGSALLAGVARFYLGVNEAFSSRYTTISMLLLVSVIVLCCQHAAIFGHLLKTYYKRVVLVVVFGVSSLVILEYGWGLHSMVGQHAHLASTYQCTHVTAPTGECLLTTYPVPQVVEPRLQFIKSIHWGGY